MAASFLAESLKLRKRPATWVLGLVWVLIVVMFGYVLPYSFVQGAAEAQQQEQQQEQALNEALLDGLMPENLLSNLFSNGPFGTGTALALILGALAAGSEYGWGTLKTSLTQRPGRAGVFLGKLLALGVALLVLVAVGLAAGAASSYGVARLEDAAVGWPAASELAKGYGAGALLFAVWAAFGFALAVLFRGTALAIGLGLAWLLAVENAVAALPIRSDAFETFRKFLPGENTLSLALSFGSVQSEGFPAQEPLLDADRAVLTLAVYAVVFIALAAVLFARRDVT
jgi:ABC-2 type transport system permease protein